MRNPVPRHPARHDADYNDEISYHELPTNNNDHSTHADTDTACSCTDSACVHNPEAMLNSISNEQMLKHFGSDTERKTPLYAHANQLTSDIAPEKPNELLL
eukprot:1811293-Rhodomonas_salina.1